jgi:hypothetical protein
MGFYTSIKNIKGNIMWKIKEIKGVRDVYCDKCNTRLHVIIISGRPGDHICDCGETFLKNEIYWLIKDAFLDEE